MRCLTGPELPFLNRAGQAHVLRDIHQKCFLETGKTFLLRHKRQRNSQKDVTSLSRMLFTPLGRLGRNPPARRAGGGIRCCQPVGDRGKPRAPYPRVAALPPPLPTKSSGGNLRGKGKMGYLSRGMFHRGPAAPVCFTEGGSTRPPLADAMPFRSRPATASSSHVPVVFSLPRNRSP